MPTVLLNFPDNYSWFKFEHPISHLMLLTQHKVHQIIHYKVMVFVFHVKYYYEIHEKSPKTLQASKQAAWNEKADPPITKP